MLPVTNISIVGIIGATIVAMIVGFLWYSPPLFGNLWMKEMGMDPKKPRKMGPPMAGALLGALLTASVMALLVKAFLAFNLVDGFIVALWVWVGFYLSMELVTYAFSEEHSVRLLLINAGHHLLALLAMSAVLVLVG